MLNFEIVISSANPANMKFLGSAFNCPHSYNKAQSDWRCINVDNIIYEKPYELNQVFEEVSADWIKSLKIKEIESYINNSIFNSNAIKEFSVYFKKEASNINLKFNDNELPSAFKTKVFDNEINKVYFNVSNDDLYIAKTNKVTFPNDNNINNQELKLSSELRSFFGAEIVKNKNISTNDNLIQALINQY